MDVKNNVEKVVEEETGDGGWVDTHFSDDATNRDSIVHDIDGGSTTASGANASSAYPSQQVTNENDNEDEDDDEPIDMVTCRV